MLKAITTGLISGSLIALGTQIADKKTKVVINQKELSQGTKAIAGGVITGVGVSVLVNFMLSKI